MRKVIVGGTIIDGISDRPLNGRSVLIDDHRIEAIDEIDVSSLPADIERIDATGKYVIPGLLNANVHLFCDLYPEVIARYYGRYDDLIVEAAQVALLNGVTTVFDTWGLRHALVRARDKINGGLAEGSRIYCAGNVIGWEGPFSHDFNQKVADVATPAFVNRINAQWVENVGRHLMWQTPEEVARHIRVYLAKGVNFLKYGSNEHFGNSSGAFLAFSPRVQSAIVEETHRAGLTAQSHTMSIEGLLVAVEAGCDIIQHANHTGPVRIPDSTIELMARRNTGTVVFPMSQHRLDWLRHHDSHRTQEMWQAADQNIRSFMELGCSILLATDGVVLSPDTLASPKLESFLAGPWEDNLFSLATGHFTWLNAMEEKGLSSMSLLRAATRNIAIAYGVDDRLGSLAPGKFADLLILDKDPLERADHYREIHLVIKGGRVVDRSSLPGPRILTAPAEPPTPEESSYIPFLTGSGTFPCSCHVSSS